MHQTRLERRLPQPVMQHPRQGGLAAIANLVRPQEHAEAVTQEAAAAVEAALQSKMVKVRSAAMQLETATSGVITEMAALSRCQMRLQSIEKHLARKIDVNRSRQQVWAGVPAWAGRRQRQRRQRQRRQRQRRPRCQQQHRAGHGMRRHWLQPMHAAGHSMRCT